MKKCPGCGVEALQYKGDGEFECLFCGKVFNVGGTPPEKTPAEEESEKADIPADVEESSSEVNEASADAEEVSSEGAPSPDEESAEDGTEDAVISSAPEEEEEIAVSVPVEDADEEEIVSSVPEEEASSLEEGPEDVPEEEVAESLPEEETPADEDADSSIPEEKEEEQVSELAEEAPAPAEEAPAPAEGTLSDNVAEEATEGAEGESPEEEVAADSEEEASPVKEEEAPAADDNSLKTVHAQKKAALAQLLPSPMPETIYTKVMGLMMPALMILLGIFFIGFLGGSVIDLLFESVTGYDIIEGLRLHGISVVDVGHNSRGGDRATGTDSVQKDEQELEVCVLCRLYVRFGDYLCCDVHSRGRRERLCICGRLHRSDAGVHHTLDDRAPVRICAVHHFGRACRKLLHKGVCGQDACRSLRPRRGGESQVRG